MRRVNHLGCRPLLEAGLDVDEVEEALDAPLEGGAGEREREVGGGDVELAGAALVQSASVLRRFLSSLIASKNRFH